MMPNDYTVVAYVSWDGGTPLVRDWFAWLETVTPLIYQVSGELP